MHLFVIYVICLPSYMSHGNDKFLHFQLQWHRECSVFLLADASINEFDFDPSIKLHDRWLGYCQEISVPIETRNAVMISFCAELYKYLYLCTSVQEAIYSEISSSANYHCH